MKKFKELREQAKTQASEGFMATGLGIIAIIGLGELLANFNDAQYAAASSRISSWVKQKKKRTSDEINSYVEKLKKDYGKSPTAAKLKAAIARFGK